MKSVYYMPRSSITSNTKWSRAGCFMNFDGKNVIKVEFVNKCELEIQRMELLSKNYQKALANAIFNSDLSEFLD